MTDLIYIGLTVVFFALMLAYVTGCERLGRRSASENELGKEQAL